MGVIIRVVYLNKKILADLKNFNKLFSYIIPTVEITKLVWLRWEPKMSPKLWTLSDKIKIAPNLVSIENLNVVKNVKIIHVGMK